MSHLSTHIFFINIEHSCSTLLLNNYYTMIKFISIDHQLIEDTSRQNSQQILFRFKEHKYKYRYLSNKHHNPTQQLQTHSIIEMSSNETKSSFIISKSRSSISVEDDRGIEFCTSEEKEGKEEIWTLYIMKWDTYE